jgi:hypothetical protein
MRYWKSNGNMIRKKKGLNVTGSVQQCGAQVQIIYENLYKLVGTHDLWSLWGALALFY